MCYNPNYHRHLGDSEVIVTIITRLSKLPSTLSDSSPSTLSSFYFEESLNGFSIAKKLYLIVKPLTAFDTTLHNLDILPLPY